MTQLYDNINLEVFEASYLDSKTVYKNENNNKTYFKAFLLNGFFNKRKFKVANPKNLHRDIDGYENLPVTLVQDGIRKGNHPNPKDANIFESSYQDKYSYVTNAIKYYRNFEVAKIVKIYKPDLNLLTASSEELAKAVRNIDPNNYYALCETQNENMLKMLVEAEKLDKKIYVSPAMFSWDWIKDPNTGEVSINSFVPTHLAIVDRPAFDPEVAYIRKEICKKDGVSCYYDLFESSELENLNNDFSASNNMSGTNTGTKPFTDLESYLKSQYSLDVVDLQNIPAEEVVKGLKDLTLTYKTKVSNNNPTPTSNPSVPTNNNDSQKPITQFTNEKEVVKEVVTKEKPKEKSSSSNFTLEDVQKLLNEQEERILNKFKEKETKAERENILGSYLENDKIKAVKDKIDVDKLQKTKELYNGLPVDNAQLQALLDSSLFNPKYANPDLYRSVLGLPTNQEVQQKEITKTTIESKQQPQQGGGSKSVTAEINKLSNTPITEIPAKSIPNINGYGTEFKSSAESTNKYNDNYKGSKSFEASSNPNANNPVPTTGEGIPRRFQKYIN